MIKANVLRIGNYVMFRDGFGGEHFTKVHSIHEEMAAIGAKTLTEDGSQGQGFMRYEGLYPIPLTPEILEKCGFEKGVIDDPPAYNLAGYIKWERLAIFLEEIQCSDGRTDWSTYVQFNVGMGFNHLVTNPPEYLHELQNLYFALTGEELIVRIPQPDII